MGVITRDIFFFSHFPPLAPNPFPPSGILGISDGLEEEVGGGEEEEDKDKEEALTRGLMAHKAEGEEN